MAVTGGIKIFKENKIKDATASSNVSGTGSVSSLLNQNRETFWRSSGSNDSTTEEIEIEFSGSKTIDRIFLLNINAKSFNIQYDVAGVYTDFSSVVGLDGALGGGISETTFAKNTAYYEFASVTTDKIRIQIDSTQTTNAEKYINQVICTEEMGTFVGYPNISAVDIDRSQRNKITVSGKYSVQKSLETFGVNLKLIDYPSLAAYNADVDLCFDLMDSEDPFLVWLCGGRYGTTYFQYTLRGFRLIDVIQMQVLKSYKVSYSKNIYINQVNIPSLDLGEVI